MQVRIDVSSVIWRNHIMIICRPNVCTKPLCKADAQTSIVSCRPKIKCMTSNLNEINGSYSLVSIPNSLTYFTTIFLINTWACENMVLCYITLSLHWNDCSYRNMAICYESWDNFLVKKISCPKIDPYSFSVAYSRMTVISFITWAPKYIQNLRFYTVKYFLCYNSLKWPYLRKNDRNYGEMHISSNKYTYRNRS